ncbi:GerMN domain-containing protein [Salipaludibacillus daqingensis]|uniref:GerMN domain-containing protein n=1 Tax=Salipaludibacillus daqingensis TaxID=3041001 RepID=UPI0024753126|nr:GerMN domain-containing protein [Salipaludibacillus daqingensis]
MQRGWSQARLAILLLGAVVIIFTACGSPNTDDVLEEIDPPQINYIEDEEDIDVDVVVMEEDAGEADGVDEDQTSSITEEDMEELEEIEEKGGPIIEDDELQEVYLLDQNGNVAPQPMKIMSDEDDKTALIEHLVQEGPVTEQIPSGFQAVLPPGTEVLSIEENSAGEILIDFNEDFSDYHPSQELQVLQSLTWTLTQLEDVDRVKISLNGELLSAMPQNDTPIGDGYTREHGINLEVNDQADLVSTTPVVVYFLSQTGDQTYYVPVTRRVNEEDDKYKAVINELLEGPSYMSQLLTDFRQEVELLEEPSFENGTVTVNFNEALLSQMEGSAISEDVLNMIVLSLTEQEGVESVSLEVESDSSIMVNNGESLTDPVVRPSRVNIGQF